MKKAHLVVWIASWLGVAILASPLCQAQILFFADFEENSRDAIPGPEVNEVQNYIGVNAAQKWQIGNFPATGGRALENLSNGCGESGPTPLPVDVHFTNGIIQAIVGWKDNDGLGFVFRQGPDGKTGYLASFNATETPAVILNLWDTCYDVGQCLQDAGPGCENPANTLAYVEHGIAPFDETGNTAYLVRVEAREDRIRVWEVPLDQVNDPMAQDLGIPPQIEVQDKTHKAGTVSLFHESCPSLWDDILVTGPGGFLAVDPRAKLATTWGTLKQR